MRILQEYQDKWIGCKCVCSGGTSRDLTTIKEAVFCTFNLTYLPCCLHPSLIYRDEAGSLLEGQVQELVLGKLLS